MKNIMAITIVILIGIIAFFIIFKNVPKISLFGNTTNNEILIKNHILDSIRNDNFRRKIIYLTDKLTSSNKINDSLSALIIKIETANKLEIKNLKGKNASELKKLREYYIDGTTDSIVDLQIVKLGKERDNCYKIRNVLEERISNMEIREVNFNKVIDAYKDEIDRNNKVKEGLVNECKRIEKECRKYGRKMKWLAIGSIGLGALFVIYAILN